MTKHESKAKAVAVKEFSWLEFLDTAKAHGASGSATEANAVKRGITGGRIEYFFHASFEDALDMGYGDGWMPESPKVDELLRYVETDLGDSMHQSFEWSFATNGSRVSVPRFLSGSPDCMIKAWPLKVMRTGRVIRLYVPATYPGSVNTSQIIGRGIAIMALVEAFSMLQHPTEIWACICNHETKGKFRTAFMVNVQGATEPLDMSRNMFALAHPAFARQLGWAIKEACTPKEYLETFGYEAGGYYGSNSREVIADDYSDMYDENVIVLPSIDNDRFDWTDEPKIVEWIKSQIARIQEGSN